MTLLRYIPNAITVTRLILVLPIAVFIIEANYFVALVLFAMSGLSDGLDGFIARRYNWVSTFGKLIDPLADKLMMVTTAVVLGSLGHFPVMLAVLIVTKDLAVLCGVFSYTTLAGFPAIQPTWLGKFTTASQIVLLVSVLLNLSFPGALPGIFFTVWFWLVATLTVVDGFSYLWIWTDRLAQDPRWRESI
jgi:cardiolipin synthase